MILSKGLFITFEGCDGSGKSTQINLLKNKMVDEGIDVHFTREPGGTSISEKIREVLLDINNSEMTSITEMYLYAASRAQLTEQTIIPLINKGTTVVCDRYLDSSIAYQGKGRGLGDAVENVNKYAVMGIAPDLTILLSIDPAKSIKRATGSNKADGIEAEGEEYQKDVYAEYKRLALENPDRIAEFDASLTIEEIHAQIWEVVSNKLHERNLI